MFNIYSLSNLLEMLCQIYKCKINKQLRINYSSDAGQLFGQLAACACAMHSEAG